VKAPFEETSSNVGGDTVFDPERVPYAGWLE
jgi:hypothetical protein